MSQQNANSANEISIANEVLECATHDQCREIDSLDVPARHERLNELVKKSVERTVLAITERSEPIRQAVDAGELLVVGAVYDLETGSVVFLDQGKGEDDEKAVG